MAVPGQVGDYGSKEIEALALAIIGSLQRVYAETDLTRWSSPTPHGFDWEISTQTQLCISCY